MDKHVEIFRSHAEADEANRQYYLSLTPEERINVLLELVAQHPDFHKKFEYVYKIRSLKQSD